VQPSEWHRTLLLPQAWLSFMNRAYNACVEVRSLRTSKLKDKILPYSWIAHVNGKWLYKLVSSLKFLALRTPLVTL